MKGAFLASAIMAVLLAGLFAACGEDEQTEEDRVTAAIEQLHEDMDAGRVREACAAMTSRAHRQIGSVGHGRKPTTCERDLRDLVRSTGDPGVPDSGLSGARRPEVVAVALSRAGRAASVTLELGSGPYRVPLVKRGGRWQLDDFFGAAGPPPRALR